MGNLLPLGKLAERAGINRDKARYWASLLGVDPVKVDGKLMAPEETVGLLEAMRKAVAAGTSPAVAAQEVKAILPLPIVQSPPARQDDTRFDSLEGAVLAMASQVGKLVEENRRLSGEVAALRGEIAQARPALAPPIPVELPRKAILWSPEPARDPADGLPWYRRAWLEIFEPERLRKTAS